MRLDLRVNAQARGMRLDVFLAQHPDLQTVSRTRLQEWIRNGQVRLDTQVLTKPNHRLQGGETIHLEVPEPIPLEAHPENLPLVILYQDEHLAVVDKPAGQVVHPSGRTISGTLVNALLYHLKDLSGIGGKLRPGIVHRLDRGTSGLLLIAKNDIAHQRISEAFKQRKIHKTYIALVQGVMKPPQGVIDMPLTRHRLIRHKMTAVISPPAQAPQSSSRRKIKAAVTRYEVQRLWDCVSLLALYPQTGRTHQIRVHLSQVGHPILGDTTYGYQWSKNREVPRRLIDQLQGIALHAWKLSLTHPVSGEPLELEAEIPLRLKNLIDYLNRQE